MDYTGYGDAPNDDLSLRQAWANMLRGLGNKQSWQELGQGIQNTAQVLPNVAESLARGGVAQAVGTFGDLRDLKNSINSYLPQPVQNLQAGMETLANPMAKALVQRSPTTEQTLEAVPRATAPYEGYKQHEFIGQFVAPPATGLLADALKLGKGLPVGASIKAVDEIPAPKVAKDELGFYSTLDEAANNLKQEKGTNAQFLAQLLKTPAVKQEEIAVRGLDKFLENNPKVTKQQIQDYLSQNKTKLGETVLDENHYAQGTYEDYRLRDAEAIDDEDWISSNADDISHDYRNDPNMVEQTRQELLAKDPERYADLENNPTNAEKLQKDVDRELDNLAYDHATANYWEDPIYRHTDDFGYEVIGNDNMGYSIKDPNGKWIEKSYNDISDVESALRDHHLEEGNLRFEEQGPKYADYQLGGPSKNYREVLIQLPENKAGEFTSGHFDEPNILAHMRVNDRVIDGKKTLFIEEIQSDWHQAGRKKGYYEPISKEKKAELEKENMYLSIERTRLSEQYNDAVKKGLPTDELEPRIAEINEQQNQIRMKLGGDSIPDAPYKKNWQEMAMRRAIQMAADGGYERVAFTTGAQQADRYNLAKQVDEIRYKKTGENQYAVAAVKDGREVIVKENQTPDQLSDLVGKEVAKKIVDNEGNKIAEGKADYNSLSGVDLQVGGEGMKGFYDKILPDYVNKYGKKYGMKVGQTKFKTGQIPSSEKEFHAIGEKYGYTPDEFDRLPPSKRKEIFDKEYQGEDVHYFDLTPEAKSSLLEKGSPLFAAPALGLTGEESRREILEKLMGK
jgi:hypothetical protein